MFGKIFEIDFLKSKSNDEDDKKSFVQKFHLQQTTCHKSNSRNLLPQWNRSQNRVTRTNIFCPELQNEVFWLIGQKIVYNWRIPSRAGFKRRNKIES